MLRVSGELLLHRLLSNPRTETGFEWATIEGLPHDATLEAVEADLSSLVVSFLLSHPSFPVTPEGGAYPVLDVVCKRCRLSLNVASVG